MKAVHEFLFRHAGLTYMDALMLRVQDAQEQRDPASSKHNVPPSYLPPGRGKGIPAPAPYHDTGFAGMTGVLTLKILLKVP